MRPFLLALSLALLPTAALADGWTAQMQDDEGGQVLIASVSGATDGNLTPSLSVLCGGTEGIMLRYLMASGEGSPGSETDFLFENESQQAKVHMIYEDMDGAFVAYFPKADPMIALLENGSDVFVSESSGNYPAQTFSLKGSTKAIAKVLKAC
jgi:hypothetical protein